MPGAIPLLSLRTQLTRIPAGGREGHLRSNPLDLRQNLHEFCPALAKLRALRMRKISPNQIADAITRRIVQRVACTGSLKLPAVPALGEWYLSLCRQVFAASGRGFAEDELTDARRLLNDHLEYAFETSNRSKVEIRFEAEPARPLAFSIKADMRSIADAYERWIGTSESPLFGEHPDARVLSLADALSDPSNCPILDFGAGTGRNALALARRGHAVDAIEITPKFAEALRDAADAEHLPLKVVERDVFKSRDGLRCDYRMIVASEVVPDFRSVAELRRLFELAIDVLADGGWLVFNLHLCALGFTPEKAARELAQQCYSCLFTPTDVAQALRGLPLRLVANDSVHDFEQTHLPAGAWPPTPWYVNWTTGRDVYDLDRTECPIEMRWLVLEKRSRSETCVVEAATLAPFEKHHRQRYDTKALRSAIEQRLMRRTSASGTLTVPAVPAMCETYTAMAVRIFSGLGRELDVVQKSSLRSQLSQMLNEAFEHSPRSNVVLTYESPIGKDLHYTISADPIPLAAAYDQWYHALQECIFGEHPDARLERLVEAITDPPQCPVLDIGAGLGRNAIYLAKRGFTVDAVESAPTFIDALNHAARSEDLPIRIVARDFFAGSQELRQDYRLLIASGFAGDLRNTELAKLFETAAKLLAPGGELLMNLHVVRDGYTPTQAALEWAQQCCATLFTTAELAQLANTYSLSLADDCSALEYEREHLPADAWPPTPAFHEWASGVHLAELEAQISPFELRWQLYRKR